METENTPQEINKFWAGVKIISCNVASLNLTTAHLDCDNNKFITKITPNLKNKADIYLLQDTRLSNKGHILKKFTLCTEWGNFDMFQNSSTNRRGVVTLINKNANIEVIEQINSVDENSMILKLKKNDSSIVIANVYGPTQTESPNFLNNLKNELNRFNNLPTILSGDFNAISDCTKPNNIRCTLNKDLIGTTNIPNPRNSKTIQDWHRRGIFFDIFRARNPNKTEYSFVSFNLASTQRSRIDLTLANELGSKLIKSTEYIFLPRCFDHKMQSIKLTIPEQSTPRPDMKNLDLVGLRETVLATILFSHLDYTDWDKEDRTPAVRCEQDETHLYTPASLYTNATILSGKLEIIKSKCKTQVELNDSLLKTIINQDILDFNAYFNENFKLNFIENQAKNINDSLFLQILVNNLSNEIISFQNGIRKSENKVKDNLYKELNKITNSSPINPTRLADIEEKISDIENIKAEKICKLNRDWQTLANERGSRAFCSLNKPKGKDDDFDVLLNCNNVPPTPFQNEEEKNVNVNGYYIELFTCIDDKITLNIQDFLGEEIINSKFVQDKKLLPDDYDRLETPISLQDIRESVKNANSGSAPGLDAHGYAFIKKFLPLLETPMLKCYIVWINEGQVMHNFGISKVKLIPKKTDLFNIKSWRPISLLSVYYKIYSGVVAIRLKSVSDHITSPCQKAYSSKKNIAEVNLDMVNTLKSANESGTSLAIVSVDFRKAFDSISHKYILQVLEFFGFGPYFRKLALACLKGKRGFIANLKNSGETFSIGCGIAQGDPSSGNFFNIILEPLLILIQKCSILQDALIKVPIEFIGPSRPLAKRLTGYADDLNAIIKATLANIKRLLEILKNFQRCSGLVTNVEKTSVCPVLTDEIFENQVINEGLKIEKTFTLLGVKYDHKGEKIDEENSKIIKQKIVNIVDLWDKFYLTIPGKITVCKTFIYSQIAYYAPFITFSNNFFNEIEDLITDFINSDRKVGGKKCFKSTKTGGLGLFKIQDYIDGIKASFFRRHFSSEDNWASCIKNSRNIENPLSFFQIDYLQRMFPTSADLCRAINRFSAGFFSYPENVDQQFVLMNQAIRHQGEPLNQRLGSGLNLTDCTVLSSMRVKDLISRDSNVLSLPELNGNLGTNFPPRIYRVLVSATVNVRRKVQLTEQKGPNIKSLIESKKKGSKIFRHYITNPTKLYTVKNFTATKTRQRWYDFDTIPTSEMILLGSWNNSGFHNDVRERLMLIIMNLFKANVHINKFARDEDGEPPSPLCRNCEISFGGQAPPENYVHLFSTCPFTEELNEMFNSIKKLEHQSPIKKFFITDHDFIENYAHRTITGLLIFHLSKMRDIITNRNNKIMDCLKDSIFALCKVQKRFKILAKEILVQDYFEN